MTKAEQRKIVLGVVRSQLRCMNELIDASMSFQDVLAILDDLSRTEPDLIASCWYIQAMDNQIKLLRREWRRQFLAKTAKSCPIFKSSVHQPLTLWQ